MKDTMKFIAIILHVIAITTFIVATIQYYLGNTGDIVLLFFIAIFSGVMSISFRLLN